MTDRSRAARPTVVGVAVLLVGGLAIFAAVVGYALADDRLSGVGPAERG